MIQINNYLGGFDNITSRLLDQAPNPAAVEARLRAEAIRVGTFYRGKAQAMASYYWGPRRANGLSLLTDRMEPLATQIASA